MMRWIDMRIFKLDKRFKLYNNNFRYCVETSTSDEYWDCFRTWTEFCEAQWGDGSTGRYRKQNNNRWRYSHDYYGLLKPRGRVFFCNEKDVTWFTLGTSA
jgi:hypothetical protein